jgi:hypothetical protein
MRSSCHVDVIGIQAMKMHDFVAELHSDLLPANLLVGDGTWRRPFGGLRKTGNRPR